jgi:hypothetical protein
VLINIYLGFRRLPHPIAAGVRAGPWRYGIHEPPSEMFGFRITDAHLADMTSFLHGRPHELMVLSQLFLSQLFLGLDLRAE